MVSGPLTLREGPFLARLGVDYIANSFKRARSVDPAAKLVLNETHTERDDAFGLVFRNGLLALVDLLLDQGMPLDAVGLQGHIMSDAPFDESRLCRVSEPDIKTRPADRDDRTRRERQEISRRHRRRATLWSRTPIAVSSTSRWPTSRSGRSLSGSLRIGPAIISSTPLMPNRASPAALARSCSTCDTGLSRR